MIRIEQLRKSFGKNMVLQGVDLNFSEPGITAILGPNGSGKTTLLKSILGMVVPDSGDIFVEDKSVKNDFQYREQISFLPQIARFPENLSGNELIKMVTALRKRAANPEPIIDRLSLKPSLDKKLKYLSGGTKQKVSITAALMFDSPILILDEPTAGLDPVALIEFKKMILAERERGKIILLTTHILNLVHELADRIIFLLEGEIFFNGSSEELLKKFNTDNFEEAIAALTMAETS